MPKMYVERSITVDAPAEKVYEKLNDFHHWSRWSPWLIQEPDAKVDVSDDGKYYEWTGNRVGSGNMTVKSEEPHRKIEYDLTFLKPWKSTADVYFYLEPKGDSTNVKWTMDSSLPFFLFWMKKSMQAYIGSDYERGLKNLKDFVEDGEVHSALEFLGKNNYPGCKYVGIENSCKMDELEKVMSADYQKLWDFVEDQNLQPSAAPFSQYHKWDVAKNNVNYTIGIPVDETTDNLPSGMKSGEIPATEVYTVRHVGPYEHSGNGWSTMMSMVRNKELKPSKKIHPFETYVNDPEDVDEKELITDIHMPLK